MPLIGSLGAAASRGFGQFLQKITAVLNTDAFFKYVTLLLTGSPPVSTFVTDASTNNLQVTINGDTKPSGFSPNENGYYSCYFDGTGDRILLSGSNLTLTGNFTVEAWVYIGSLATLRPILCIGDDRVGSGVLFCVNTTGKLLIYSNNASVLTGTGTSVVANTWTHVAFVRSGTTITGYVNGAIQGTATSSATFTGIASYIGMEFYNSATGAEFLGNISNLRVVDGTAVYTSAFTPSTTPLTAISGTTLLACQANRFIDNSSSPKAMTVIGQTYIAGFQPFTPNPSFATYGSTYFDGSGDYLLTPTSTSFGFGTGDFTIEFWAYSSVNARQDWLDITNGSQRILIYYSGSAVTVYTTPPNSAAITGGALVLNTWNHYAVSKSGGNLRLFVNGVQAGSTYTTSQDYGSSNLVCVGKDYYGSTYITGYISNLRIVKGTALYTSAFTPPTTQLTAVTNTSLLTCQTNQPVNNNVFLDSSSNNFPITRAGNTTQGSLNPYGGNWSNYFDGSTSYLNATSTLIPTTQSTFTIEAWVYMTASPNGTYIPGMCGDMLGNSNTNYMSFGPVTITGTRYVGFYWYDPTQRNCYGNTALNLNTWYHIAISISSNIIKMFVNGVSQTITYSSGVTGLTNRGGTTSGFTVGGFNGATNSYIGNISNLRVVNGTAIYTTNFTPSTTPLTAVANTALLTCQSNRLIDNSTSARALTRTGTVRVQRFSPFAPVIQTPTSYSNYFDGSAYLSTATSANLTIGTQAFTVEFWVYHTTLGTSTQYVDSASGGFSLSKNTSNQIVVAQSGVAALITTTATLAVNTWYQVAITRNASNLVTVWINGVSSGTATLTTNFSNQYLVLGRQAGAATAYLSGYISNLRQVIGTALYTTSFTPPTTPLTAVSGTSLLTCQSPTFIDNSANNFAITATGDVAARTQNPFGVTNTDAPYTPATYGGSMYFDGTNDYLIAPLGVNSALGNTCTVELWYYPLTSPPTARLINNSTAAGTSLDVYDLDSKIGFANQVATTTKVQLNAWTHIAFVVTSGTLKIYFNGVSQPLSGTSTGINITATGNTWIGGINGYSQWTNGYMSNIRLVKGTALYAANFAPPVAPLQAVTNTSLLLLGSNGAVYDSAMLNNEETVGDAKVSTAVSKFGGSSMYFDGSDNLSIPLNTSYKIGTGDFTIEAWVYHTNSGSYAGYYYGGNSGLVLRRTDANKLEISQDAVASIAISTNTIPSNQWVHVAGTRSGTTVRIFINGVLEGTVTYSGNFAPTTAATVGSIARVARYYMTGYIDDLRITNGYARYTQNFTVPTQPFPVQ